ncbi:DUF6093 family protein [Streptosporangium sp. NBC_01810]|uniref:DUF6093 family protein n=1 Tax=Streptosporangium sp. NBC_01810 TaxID=2975951 RepID=UPI002DD9DE6E|nr:DUF6093 family protein [Streptosporangium sp. NBC_01810]WSA23681.1 DUF6093 family protein [Streptosporangium sp. NBC_01810]
MSVDGVLAQGRAAALRLMRDTCTVERKDGEPVLNQTTGQLEQPWETVYTGVCRVKPRTQREAEWGEREVALGAYVAVLPWDASPEIQRGDRLTITASDDAWLIGRPLEVIAIALSGTSTARRILVEDKEG